MRTFETADPDTYFIFIIGSIGLNDLTSRADKGNAMRTFFAKTALLGTLALPLALPAVVEAARTPQELLRNQVLRLHGRLSSDALQSPEVLEAQAAAGRSFAALYQIRENILVDLRKREDYTDLRLALWHQQQALAGMHLEVPVKIKSILATAGDSMSLRRRISQLEIETLESSDAYIAARDEFNALVAAQQRAIADALDRVRTDPQLASLSQQLQSMRRVYGRSSGLSR